MTLYTIALFLHIVGALGLYVALGLEWTMLWQARHATSLVQVQEWLKILPWQRRLGPASLVLILIPGLGMAFAVWGAAAWILVSFGAMVLIAALGALNGIPMAALAGNLEKEGAELSTVSLSQLNNPLRQLSIQTRVFIALGIVFLMVTKPELPGVLQVMAISIVLGLAVGWLVGRDRTVRPVPS